MVGCAMGELAQNVEPLAAPDDSTASQGLQRLGLGPGCYLLLLVGLCSCLFMPSSLLGNFLPPQLGCTQLPSVILLMTLTEDDLDPCTQE